MPHEPHEDGVLRPRYNKLPSLAGRTLNPDARRLGLKVSQQNLNSLLSTERGLYFIRGIDAEGNAIYEPIGTLAGTTPFVVGLSSDNRFQGIRAALAAAVAIGVSDPYIFLKPGRYQEEGEIILPPNMRITIVGASREQVTVESRITVSRTGVSVLENLTIIPTIAGAAITMSANVPTLGETACLHLRTLTLDAPLSAGRPTLDIDGLVAGPGGNFCFARECDILQSNSAERAIEVAEFAFLELENCLVSKVSGPTTVLFLGVVDVLRSTIAYLIAISGSSVTRFEDSVQVPGSPLISVLTLAAAVLVQAFGFRIDTNMSLGAPYFAGVGTLIIDELYLGASSAPAPLGGIASPAITVLTRPGVVDDFQWGAAQADAGAPAAQVFPGGPPPPAQPFVGLVAGVASGGVDFGVTTADRFTVVEPGHYRLTFQGSQVAPSAGGIAATVTAILNPDTAATVIKSCGPIVANAAGDAYAGFAFDSLVLLASGDDIEFQIATVTPGATFTFASPGASLARLAQ